MPESKKTHPRKKPGDMIRTLRFDLSVEETTIHIYHVHSENELYINEQSKITAAFPVILS